MLDARCYVFMGVDDIFNLLIYVREMYSIRKREKVDSIYYSQPL